jgi:hypothetical protein
LILDFRLPEHSMTTATAVKQSVNAAGESHLGAAGAFFDDQGEIPASGEVEQLAARIARADGKEGPHKGTLRALDEA